MTRAPSPAGVPGSGQASRRSQFRCTVAANEALCREHFRLVLRLPFFPPTAPGQFVQVSCHDLTEMPDDSFEREAEWSPGRPPRLNGQEIETPVALLRRPFSLASRRDTPAGVELDIIHRVVGIGTDWLSRLSVGDSVDVLGPLGNRFTSPPSGATAVLVGGGVGIPPMLYLATKLAGQPAVAFSGALSKDLVPLTLSGVDTAGRQAPAEPAMRVGEFSRYQIPSVVSTDDGSYGFRGFVTQALEVYLDRHHVRGATSSSSPPVIYTCGPELMMKRVAQIAADRGLECQVAVERAMACGMGTCQSCCIRVRKPDPSKPPLVGRDWCYRLACTDGPVFRGADLLW